MTNIDLSSRAAIQDVLLRYYRGIDQKDFTLVQSAFHEDARLSTQRGDDWSVAQFIEFAASSDALGGCNATMHFAGNMSIDVQGEQASAETYAICHHDCNERMTRAGWTNRFIVVWLIYDDRLMFRDGRWAISNRRFRPLWVRDMTEGARLVTTPGASA